MEKNTYDRKTVCIVILYTHLTYIVVWILVISCREYNWLFLHVQMNKNGYESM